MLTWIENDEKNICCGATGEKIKSTLEQSANNQERQNLFVYMRAITYYQKVQLFISRVVTKNDWNWKNDFDKKKMQEMRIESSVTGDGNTRRLEDSNKFNLM